MKRGNRLKAGNLPKLAPNPYYRSWTLGRLLFLYATSLFKTGFSRTIDIEDIPDLRADFTYRSNAHRFNEIWANAKGPRRNLKLVVLRQFMWHILLSIVLVTFLSVVIQLKPLVLKEIMTSVDPTIDPSTSAWVWAVLFAGVCIVETLITSFMTEISVSLLVKTSTTLQGEVYRKIFRLNNAESQRSKPGEVVNLFTIDISRTAMFFEVFRVAWGDLIMLVVGFFFLFRLLGLTMLTAIGVAAFVLILTTACLGFWARVRGEKLRASDKRVQATTETLNGMRIIKYYAWEQFFYEKIQGIRDLELDRLKVLTVLQVIVMCVMVMLPLLITVSTLSVYALVSKEFTAATIFTALSYFNLLKTPLMSLPRTQADLVSSLVSLNRLEEFLNLPERTEKTDEDELGFSSYAPPPDSSVAISLRNASFKYADSSRSNSSSTQINAEEDTSDKQRLIGRSLAMERMPVPAASSQGALVDIDLEVRHGSLVCVIGGIGSGKTSLIRAILGEMDMTQGTRDIDSYSSVAYCAQQAWIMNNTIRENILFGYPYDEERYQDIMRACCLVDDMRQQPAGDNTEIGEKGVNLSGGQKQRISIARAAYSGADIVLLDDPLSAVDAHVGRSLFNNCINGTMQGKTRILVTHQLQYVVHADLIVYMKDGRIIETGTYNQLMSKRDSEFSNLINQFAVMDNQDDTEADKPKKKKKEEAVDQAGSIEDGQLVEEESRNEGAVSVATYLDYIHACGGYGRFALIILLFTISETLTAVTTWWLGVMTQSSMGKLQAVGVYALIALFVVISQFVRDFFFAMFVLRASRVYHDEAIIKVMRAKMSFFETTPIGRILNRFSQGIESVDYDISFMTKEFLNTTSTLISTIVVISLFTPWFIVPMIGIAIIFMVVQVVYRRTYREIARLDPLVNAPLLSFVSETYSGLPTIRAYKQEQRYLDMSTQTINFANTICATNGATRAWLANILGYIGSLISFSAAAACILQSNVSPATAGISLNYALQVYPLLGGFINIATFTEAKFNVIDRINDYRQHLESEADAILPHNRPSPSWPHAGEIIINKLVMQYRENLPPALKDVTLHINPSEKIGVVGRTGAGKSSLLIALFRIVEPKYGSIYIDGIDICRIGLYDLRSRISIIPQDPVLFKGTMRSNLDPFGQYQDHQIWQVLERAHLKPTVERLPGKLNSEIEDNGSNFSVGQRQLICLARAMLRNTKVIVLDEATASVDVETDHVIQQTLRREFQDVTMIVIAHRLHTVIDSDRILLMDKGQVAEFDRPYNLLANPNSMFTKLVMETGAASEALIKRAEYNRTLSPLSP